MFQQLLYVALTVLIIGLTLYLIRRMDLLWRLPLRFLALRVVLFIQHRRSCATADLSYIASLKFASSCGRYVLLENSRKQDAKLRKRFRSGGAS